MKKKAEDLKPGEIFRSDAGERYVIVHSWGGDEAMIAPVGQSSMGIVRWRFADVVEVESPTLSPAQQHAEELLGLARLLVEGTPAKDVQHAMADLLARIDPPKPPSVEELAEALAAIRSSINAPGSAARVMDFDKADKVLERARQAGYLGKDAQ